MYEDYYDAQIINEAQKCIKLGTLFTLFRQRKIMNL